MAHTFVEEVANHAWMLLLMAARRGLWLHELGTTIRSPEAQAQLFPVLKLAMPRVTGQTLGLIAFGRIARATARRAQAFGMTASPTTPSSRQRPSGRRVSSRSRWTRSSNAPTSSPATCR